MRYDKIAKYLSELSFGHGRVVSIVLHESFPRIVFIVTDGHYELSHTERNQNDCL